MISLAGKVVTVTGAASGIGLATAKVLFAAGAKLSLTDLREESLAKAVSAISSGSSSPRKNIITTALDIRSSKQVDAWIGKTVSHFGRLDGSANVAGAIGKGYGTHDVTDLSDEEFDFVTGTNLTGLFYCMRAQLRAMTDGGSVVNTASTTGLEGHAKNAAYSASKHAVIGLSKSAANEVGPKGIRVNCVAPGIFDTPMVQSFGSVASGKLAVFDRVPLKRVGHPEEAGKVLAFLLSDDAKYVTGSTFVVDGGMLS
ncbi:MAG: hypothetical protein M1818_006969 [Claussenomyces sp. TS43310]|nr:MAG: hypothetical protein M1818_006969 [Claussenomyces sp. TS43310]